MKESFYSPSDAVSCVALPEYDEAKAREALLVLLEPIGGLDFVKAGMTVVIKANLVSVMKPERGATTHPVLLCALTRLLIERGARVIVGDSPGGLYTRAFVGRVYKVAGLDAVSEAGAELNDDFSELTAEYADGVVLKSFTYTGYLDKADVIINFCKLKSHGMMGMSCAAKNMFGVVPGIIKPEYHFRFPEYEDFANMILDLDEYFHPVLSIADAVVGMEGNGPTAGDAKHIGVLLASRSPHTLDLCAARLIGIDPTTLPTLNASLARGLIPDSFEGVTLYGDLEALLVKDFKTVMERRSMLFSGDGKNPIKRFFSKIAASVLKTRPVLKNKMCVGCGVCRDICPAKAIVIEKGKARIDRKACIRCFCCQEFCSKSAMKVGRSAIGAVFHRSEKKRSEK